MVINGNILYYTKPIKDMAKEKLVGPGGTTYGLGEAGYDIRIKQDIRFYRKEGHISARVDGVIHGDTRFTLASAIEEFQMPSTLVGVVHDKSTWARRGLSVFNTVIEPGWKGFLTLELVYHGDTELVIPAGAGIAQVVFTNLQENARYTGKYQDQPDKPTGPINS